MTNDRPSWLLTARVDDLAEWDQQLIFSPLEMLYANSLGCVIDALTTRVLGPIEDDGPDGDAREARLVDTDGQLQPFVRLLLCDLRWLAMAPGWTPAMRFRRAIDAMTWAGF